MSTSSIISVSRRTDIAAYYSEWFMNRIRRGSVTWANPYSGQVYRTSLLPEDVAAFVFLSKNFGPLISHLDELDRMGYHSIFHFTITGLPKVFEPNVPEPEQTIPVAKYLAERYGSEAMLWPASPAITESISIPAAATT